ncbi:MAG: PDZ domain-containing protein [Candidatus Latescibacteria bacterium]|nr:PDZ domain-containing protein [Candidatus Latescibacterota bacterium]
MKATAVEPYSFAQALGIRPGDQIMEIDGRPLADIIDYNCLICGQRL